MDNSKPEDGITDETGEYGVGVDKDTGAMVGDTGTPDIKSADVKAGEESAHKDNTDKDNTEAS